MLFLFVDREQRGTIWTSSLVASSVPVKMCLTVGNSVQVGLNSKRGLLAVVSRCSEVCGGTEENNVVTQIWLLPFALCLPHFPSIVGSFVWSQDDHQWLLEPWLPYSRPEPNTQVSDRNGNSSPSSHQLCASDVIPQSEDAKERLNGQWESALCPPSILKC